MKLNDSHFDGSSVPPRLTDAVEKFSRLQTELVSEVLRRAVGDASAVMAHRLSEPLSALLLYLHELKQASEQSDGTEAASTRAIVDLALRETRRVCDIIEQIGRRDEISGDAEFGLARGQEIDTWAPENRIQSDGARAPPPVHARVNPHPLTPREHEVIALIMDGASNKEGAHRLGISTRTFEAHRAHLMRKLGARNAADLIRKMSGQSE